MRRSEKKEDAGARKGRKVAIHCVFPTICVSGGSKSRLTKAAGAEPAGQMRDEKLHAVVARSTFPGQNVQNTPGSDHFWQLRCRLYHSFLFSHNHDCGVCYHTCGHPGSWASPGFLSLRCSCIIGCPGKYVWRISYYSVMKLEASGWKREKGIVHVHNSFATACEFSDWFSSGWLFSLFALLLGIVCTCENPCRFRMR